MKQPLGIVNASLALLMAAVTCLYCVIMLVAFLIYLGNPGDVAQAAFIIFNFVIAALCAWLSIPKAKGVLSTLCEAPRYRRLLPKDKTITVDAMASMLGRGDVDGVMFDLQCLFLWARFDWLNLWGFRGFSLDETTRAITPIASRGLEKVVRSAAQIVTGNADPQEHSFSCRQCGAENKIMALPGHTLSCEFCGTPYRK